MIKFFIAATLLLASHSINAQQDPSTTQFWNHYAHFNPAMTAINYDHFAAVSYRSYARRYEGNPIESYVNYNLRLKHKHGLGINYGFDQVGFSKSNSVNINYNYQLRVSRTQRISFGTAVGFKHYSFDPDWQGSWTPGPTDPFTSTKPNLNLGVAYSGRYLQSGIGVTHVIPLNLGNDSTYTFNNERHYNLHASYKFNIGDQKNLTIQPQLILRSDLAFTSINTGVLFKLYKDYLVGFGYNLRNSISFIAGWDIKGRYRINYSYDLSTSKLSKTYAGRHEITLGFLMFNKPPPPTRIILQDF